jgi:hypothetical protein
MVSVRRSGQSFLRNAPQNLAAGKTIASDCVDHHPAAIGREEDEPLVAYLANIDDVFPEDECNHCDMA